MKRREFLSRTASLAAAGTLGALSARLSGAAEQKPNILFITTDQQSIDAMSCAGNKFVRTPAMDSLAARGIRFTRSYCTGAQCTPSRSSWFTSRMPHEVNCYKNGNRVKKGETKPGLPPGIPSMGTYFRAAGYETAYAGKWHLSVPWPAYAKRDDQRAIPGFDVLPLGGDRSAAAEETATPGLTIDPHTTDAAVAFLKKKHEKPFLLAVNLLNPHDICGYANNIEKYPKAEITAPAVDNLYATNREPQSIGENRKELRRAAGWGTAEWGTYRSTYYRLTEIVDGLIGRVLAALTESGLAGNTVVIFTSDHGELMGAHQLTTKNRLYEEAVAVPFIIAAPGMRAGVDSEHLVSGIDILPTMCDFAGIAPDPAFEGRSLKPLAEGRSPAAWRDYVVCSNGSYDDCRMVRTARYKYIVYDTGANPEQFFDCMNDPGETKNLVTDAALQETIAAHRALLAKSIADTGDSFVIPKSGVTGG